MSVKQKRFRKSTLCIAIATSTMLLTGCGAGTGTTASVSDQSVRASEDQPEAPSSTVVLTVRLPQRMMNLGIPIDVVATVSGETLTMSKNGDIYNLDIALPLFREYAIFFAAQRSSDGLILASAQTTVSTDANVVPMAIPQQLFSTAIDDDSDGFDNISEIERGSEPVCKQLTLTATAFRTNQTAMMTTTVF